MTAFSTMSLFGKLRRRQFLLLYFSNVLRVGMFTGGSGDQGSHSLDGKIPTVLGGNLQGRAGGGLPYDMVRSCGRPRSIPHARRPCLPLAAATRLTLRLADARRRVCPAEDFRRRMGPSMGLPGTLWLEVSLQWPYCHLGAQ